MSFKLRTCKKSGLQWKQYNSLQKCPCDYCTVVIVGKRKFKSSPIKRQKTIRKISAKQEKKNEEYMVVRNSFLSLLENKICPITKQPTTEVHHKAGRAGFADEWARLNNTPLLIDVRYFLAVSRNGHRWIEENPAEAKQMGYSVDRLTLK